MKMFKNGLGDRVRICGGAENGEIIGRAEYSNSSDRYLVRYVAGDGRATEQWWDCNALTPLGSADSLHAVGSR